MNIVLLSMNIFQSRCLLNISTTECQWKRWQAAGRVDSAKWFSLSRSFLTGICRGKSPSWPGFCNSAQVYQACLRPTTMPLGYIKKLKQSTSTVNHRIQCWYGTIQSDRHGAYMQVLIGNDDNQWTSSWIHYGSLWRTARIEAHWNIWRQIFLVWRQG